MGGEQYGYCTPPRSPRYEGPNEYGDTSTSTRSTSRPAKREASTPAPNATHRSGCTSSRGSSLVRSRSRRDTSGVRVDPPTSRMASRSPGFLPASSSAFDTLSSVDSTRCRIIFSYSPRDSSTSRWSGFPSTVIRASSRICAWNHLLVFPARQFHLQVERLAVHRDQGFLADLRVRLEAELL